MNYLHESQGRTLSKTVEERKVTLCAERETARRYFMVKSSIHYETTSAESKRSCFQGKKDTPQK